MTGNLANMRKNYMRNSLDETSAAVDPFDQFQTWFNEVRGTDALEANSMTLATVDQHGAPSARTVLLKECDQRGLVFYTNHDSRKGRNIVENPAVALVFNWPTLERQVRIEGLASRVTDEESDAYFQSRPVGSQIGAAASPQSEPVPDRAFLEARFERLSNSAESIRRPANWGGYRVTPAMFEFWQGRPNRLHDRLRYDRTPHGWEIIRLAP
ncbi:MAG: pyridoxamine 5'-phosphate oxidase [Chloroflexia bacterium]|nr:pyridoxamine 5'-phosphate oxidase [Chloroflexia bacterium]